MTINSLKQPRIIEGRTRFTFDQALKLCSKKVNQQSFFDSCRDCYYYDCRCELHINTESYFSPMRHCIYYTPDVTFTNIVRKNILHKPSWCETNWDQLCQTDKELFIAIYGDSPNRW